MNKIDCFMCGACCTEISISSSIPGMPNGKNAGVRCINLNDNNLCSIFGDPSRPPICSSFQADKDFCGSTTKEAIINIRRFEDLTKPATT